MDSRKKTDRDDEPTQRLPRESLADCAAYHRALLASRGLVSAESARKAGK